MGHLGGPCKRLWVGLNGSHFMTALWVLGRCPKFLNKVQWRIRYSLTHPNPVLNWPKSKTKCQFLGLSLLNAGLVWCFLLEWKCYRFNLYGFLPFNFLTSDWYLMMRNDCIGKSSDSTCLVSSQVKPEQLIFPFFNNIYTSTFSTALCCRISL